MILEETRGLGGNGPEDVERLFAKLATGKEFVEFLTLPAYDDLLLREGRL
jgi:hypothetical protein